MTKNVNHIQHLKSSVVENGKPKLPTANVLVEGEIAVNYADGYEALSIKSSSGNITTFSSDDYYTEQKLGSGFTGANSANTVTSVIRGNELVVSSALNDLKATLNGKQEALVSGTNIKTINYESILGSGNITIQGGGGGGGDVNVIESITFNGNSVPVDANKNAAISYTETDPVFTASAAYGITSSDIANWNATTADISGKADKVTGAINGNFAALDSNGNLTDSGHKHSDYLTSHQDLSNYVQKNNTTGLLKNDGTVDTNSYMKTVSGTTGNIIIKSSASGQVQVSSYSPDGIAVSAKNSAIEAITGQDGDELPTMTLYAIKSYIDSEVARLTALIGGGAKAGWRDCDGLTGVPGNGTKILCDGDGKVVVIDDGKGNAYWIYLDGTDVKSLPYDIYSGDYTLIDSYGYGEQTYSYTEDIDPNTGNYVKIFTVSSTEYTFDDMLYTISPEVSDWTSGSSSGLVGCPPKWFDLMPSGGQFDGSKILVNSDGQVVMLLDYQNNTYVVLLDTNDEIVVVNEGSVQNHVTRYGKATYNDYFSNDTHKFILNYKEYTIDTQKFTITPSDIEDWPKEESNSDLLWRQSPASQNETWLVTKNGDVILIEISDWGYTQYYGVRKNLNNSEIRLETNVYYNYQAWGWNAENVVGTQNGSVTSFDYNNVTYEVDTNGQGSITPDVTGTY